MGAIGPVGIRDPGFLGQKAFNNNSEKCIFFKIVLLAVTVQQMSFLISSCCIINDPVFQDEKVNAYMINLFLRHPQNPPTTLAPIEIINSDLMTRVDGLLSAQMKFHQIAPVESCRNRRLVPEIRLLQVPCN